MAEDELDDLGFDEPIEAAPDEERLHPILTNAEFLAAQGKARASVEADRRKAAMKAVQEAETVRLQREEGLVTGVGVKDEMVTFTVDLPPFAKDLTINTVDIYSHGHTYTRPRHVADSIKETMDRQWKHEDEVKGRSMTEHYGSARNVTLSPVRGEQSAPKVTYAS